MLKEALEFQHGLGKAAMEPVRVELPGNKLLINIGGEHQTIDRDAPSRRDTVTTLASFIDWANNRPDDQLLDVWVTPKHVEAVWNFAEPHKSERCRLPLEHSQAWKTLADWDGKSANQRETVRRLRGPLYDTYDVNYLRVFKAMDFGRKNDGARSVSHKGESMGKSVESLAQSREGDIPEVIAFSVPCYDFEGSPLVVVRMAVEVNADNEAIGLFAIGDTFIQGIRASQAEIRTTIAGKVPVANVYQA